MGYGDISEVDPAEEVARVAMSRRPRLLRLYRRRLRAEDLEDCYSQATLELLARSRSGPFFASREHLANLLELRFKSRIDDRRRAVEGRSAIEAALAHAVPVDAGCRGAAELEDRGAEVERKVFARTEVRRLHELIADLSRDQQLVLGSQILVDIEPVEFCARHGWSIEKYRKVAQRARGKLRALLEEYERGERCRRLEPDLLALGSGAAEGGALERARTHIANCRNCARMVGEVERNGHSALLPLPAVATAGIGAKLAGACAVVRRALGVARHPITEASASGGAGVAGGSLVSAGAIKVGIVAVCVAGAAGSYAACSHLGVLPALGLAQVQHHTAHHRQPSAPRRQHRHGDAERAAQRASAPGSALTSVTRTASTSTMSAASAGTPIAELAASSPHARHRTPHLTSLEQIRREFSGAAARAASAGASAHTHAPHSNAASHRALAQIRREFGTPVARPASPTQSLPASGAAPAAAAAGSGASSSTGAGVNTATSTAAQEPPATSTGAATPAATAPAAAQAPKQTPSQAGQTQAEFGFEK